MSAATATMPLIRGILRRHWLRAVIWVSAIAAMVVATVGSIEGLYPTQESLDQAARVSDNAAIIVFNGPAQGLDTVGGQVAFQIGAFGLAVVGLMSIMMIGALTRGEEESGRMEMIRSLPVGAHAPNIAAFVVVSAMSVVLGLLVVTTLLASGLEVAGSLALALCFALTGLMFAGVGGVTAQLSENTRVTYGVGGAVLGASFLLRAVGDVTGGTLSWLSPIGLVQKSRPFAGEQWLPLALAAVLAAVLFGLGAFLASRRDLAGGLIPGRPGPERAGRLLGSVEGFALRLHRGSLVGWTLGVVAMGAAYGSIGDSIEDFIAENEQILEMVARAGVDVDLSASYLATSFATVCLLAAAFGIQTVLRVRSEEAGLRAEPVLATPMPRARWAISHYVVAAMGTIAILAVGALSVGLSYGLVTGKFGPTARMFQAVLAYTPAVWVLVAVAVLIVGWLPGWSNVAWAGLAFSFVVAMFGTLLDLPTFVFNLSPVDHVPLVPAVAFEWTPVLVMTAVAAAMTALGLAGLQRRDIG